MSKHSDEQPPRRRRQRREDVRTGKFEPGRRPASPRRPPRRHDERRQRRLEAQPLPPERRLPRKLPERLAPLVEEFLATQPFALDPFQIEAAQHLAEGRSVLVAAPTGTGKALDINTPVLAPGGWVRMGDINIGDEVIGADGRPARVLGVYPQGRRPAYRVTFSDGVAIVCDVDHLWAVNTKRRRHQNLPWR